MDRTAGYDSLTWKPWLIVGFILLLAVLVLLYPLESLRAWQPGSAAYVVPVLRGVRGERVRRGGTTRRKTRRP